MAVCHQDIGKRLWGIACPALDLDHDGDGSPYLHFFSQHPSSNIDNKKNSPRSRTPQPLFADLYTTIAFPSSHSNIQPRHLNLALGVITN